MKISKLMLASVLILAGAIASDSAFADRGRSGRSSQFSKSSGFARHGHVAQPKRFGHFSRHSRTGIFIGVPIFAPLYAPLPYYYPPRPAAPTVYIEQASEPQDPVQEQSYWYYCAEAKAYYPYVSDCPGGWQQVVPQSSPD
ncbi:MAG: hypothetical protein HY661_00015 [Betaproteobacteria bacterium]|nr:hypothetical protein [Betaproteobacteria bacterium]